MSLKTPVRRLFNIIVFVFLLTSFQTALAQADAVPTDQAKIDAGAKLFKQNCSPCHKIQEKLIGPALAGVYDRREIPWIINFVHNSQKVIASGDEYAVKLFTDMGKVEMPSFDFLSEDDVVSILAYVKDEASKPQETAQPGAAPGQQVVAQQPPTGYLMAILIGLLFILLLILIVLVLIIGILKRYITQRADLDEADREVVSGGMSFSKILRNRATIGVIAFVFTVIVVKNVIDGLYHVGIQQDYAPTQPIAFSHARHAGQFKIDCNYCHTGVRKAKNANIPSANICMNCHSEILKDSPEIQKIYAAISSNTPIEWVRVHNLPDLVFFSHEQHVKVGNIECQTCHGPVETMEVLKQFAPLTMGWCVDCHRKTDVNTNGNAYYDKLVELHKKDSKEPLKVEDIGGLECAKCHY